MTEKVKTVSNWFFENCSLGDMLTVIQKTEGTISILNTTSSHVIEISVKPKESLVFPEPKC